MYIANNKFIQFALEYWSSKSWIFSSGTPKNLPTIWNGILWWVFEWGLEIYYQEINKKKRDVGI